DLEIQQRLCAHAPDLLQVAAAGNPDHQRRKDQGRDDRLDQIKEDVAEEINVISPLRAEVSNHAADNQTNQNLSGQRRSIPGTASKLNSGCSSHLRSKLLRYGTARGSEWVS